MELTDWVKSFRVQHERARQHLLTSEERELYLEAREQFARLLLAAQGQIVPVGAPARRNFRVPKGLVLDVNLQAGPVRSRTLDISVGGLSCNLGQALAKETHCGVSVWLPGDEVPLAGRARVVKAEELAPGTVQTAFAFTSMSDEDRERLEMMIFDLALNYMPT